MLDLTTRDQRYLPFEGAGAMSTWRLELPAEFRPFDYRTITDVILHLTYSASADGSLRTEVEKTQSPHAQALASRLKSTSLRQVVSLRQEFSPAFQRLVNSPKGTDVPLVLDRWTLPLFVGTRTATVTRARLAVVARPGQDIGTFAMRVDGTAFTDFDADGELGGLPAVDLDDVLENTLLGTHKLSVIDTGDLKPVNPVTGDAAALDREKVVDLLLAIEYTVGGSVPT